MYQETINKLIDNLGDDVIFTGDVVDYINLNNTNIPYDINTIDIYIPNILVLQKLRAIFSERIPYVKTFTGKTIHFSTECKISKYCIMSLHLNVYMILNDDIFDKIDKQVKVFNDKDIICISNESRFHEIKNSINYNYINNPYDNKILEKLKRIVIYKNMETV